MSRCHCVVAVRRSQQRGMQRAAHMAEALRGARLERQIQTVLDVCSLQMASFAVSTLLLTRPCVCVRALETMGKWWTMSVWMTALMMSLRSSRQRAGSTAASTSALAPPASRPYMAARWRFSSTLASLYTSASSCRTFTRYALFTPAACREPAWYRPDAVLLLCRQKAIRTA
jgi:hypothetical protein